MMHVSDAAARVLRFSDQYNPVPGFVAGCNSWGFPEMTEENKSDSAIMLIHAGVIQW